MLRVSGLDQPHYLRTIGLQKWTPDHGWSVDELSDGQLPNPAPPAAAISQITVDRVRPTATNSCPSTTAPRGQRHRLRLDLRRGPGIGAPGRTPSPRRRTSVDASFTQPSAEQLRADSVTPGGELTETGDLPAEVRDDSPTTSPPGRPPPSTRPMRCAATSPIRRTDSPTRWTVPDGPTGDPLVNFLTNKQGYCEQYASAMAIMLRAVGMPARVGDRLHPGHPGPPTAAT